MTLQKSIQRLSWRFGSEKPFLPNGNDREAINAIIDFINNANEDAVHYNQGFAKLYVMVYHQMLEQYNATVFDDIPQKQLHRLLDKPINYFFKRFTERLNDNEAYELFEEKLTQEKALKLLSDEESMKKLSGEVWNEEDVSNNLMAMIALAVNKYNKPKQ